MVLRWCIICCDKAFPVAVSLPVMISMPPELDVRPGELIDVTFRREGATKEG